MPPTATLKADLRALYEGQGPRADRFRYAMLGFDILTIVFLVVSTFFYGTVWVEWLDLIFGLYILADYSARCWIAEKKTAFVFNPLNLADLLAMISFLAPLAGESLGFLRALRMMRFLRSFQLLVSLRRDCPFFHHHEDLIRNGVHLGVFIFIMTQVVFVTQVGINPGINNFLDAMYFTITTLTTTGFGDVTLKGSLGKFLSIVIMICGVSLFLRLLKSIFRPAKVRHDCNDCGLYWHEYDAVHCKHCGRVIDIPSDGDA